MIEVFIIGVLLGAALGAVLMRLHYTGEELEHSEAIDRLIEKQDGIIYAQQIEIEELKNGRFLAKNPNNNRKGGKL